MATNMQVIEEVEFSSLPQHIAIIMDGNGRWAVKRHKPRFTGHKAGVESVRSVVESCTKLGIKALTLFAFSSENWQRPKKEVDTLMELFVTALGREVKSLHQNNIRLRFIGDRSAFKPKLQDRIHESESLTAANTGMNLSIAANYGGKWDITQAVQKIAAEVKQGNLDVADISADSIQEHICLNDLPEPDLFIRTGGEHRISNFLIWQLAYTELYFTPILWPDFDQSTLIDALQSYAGRQRRFGQTGEQVVKLNNA